MVIDEHHIVTSMFFSDCQGNGIKDYANYSVPTFSKEERLQS
jgi:catechol-2,3-dioxygenase